MRIAGGHVWRATRTPEGPATAHFWSEGAELLVQAWGPGTEWIGERVGDLVGLRDVPGAFVAHHRVLRDLHRRHPGMRFGATRAVTEAAICAVLEQKVRGIDAARSYRQVVARCSEPAPGPAELMLPPDPAVMAQLGYYDFHPFGVEKRRATTLLRVCALAPKLEAAASASPAEATALLTLIPGVGAWTAAEVTRLALGDVDAVSVGDFHLPHLVSWVLAGEPRGDDERMLELLEPYRGQRGRALRLLELSGMTPPRRGPRYTPIPIARL